ncbi:hypothetical protein [Gimesia fumaroli]|uniref:Uncharacterized protein n=1 Tax=Gimesia fumaroli TaxID=2527976 RepID=A0A518IGS4_9PLAN|nr:hypothetical protein [Gimesia fumaroli]QDV52287.1 hypothetical protein Enr17x_43470 [Gimesia fumaroli]
MTAYTKVSDEYLQSEAILGTGWRGSFGELAVKLGRTTRSALLAVRMVQAYQKTNPGWNPANVYRVS